MLKVKCDNAHTKRMLITGQEKLRKKNQILEKFFVRDYMTDRQREEAYYFAIYAIQPKKSNVNVNVNEDKKRRDKLVRLRAAHKDKTLVIRDEQIMEKCRKDVFPFSE